MASLIFSSSSHAAGLGPTRLEIIHAEISSNKARYEGWQILQIDHYKDKTAVGHEFHVLRVRRDNEEILVRLERRPGTQAASGPGASSSSEVVTEDTISRLDSHNFCPSNYYHISTTVCEEHPAFTLLDMCILCAFLMRAAPTYSVTRATHCFWFCTAFLIQVRKHGYSLRPIKNCADYAKRGRFSGFRTLTEKYVEKMLDEPAAAHGPTSLPYYFVQKLLYLFFHTDTHAWMPAKEDLTGHTALVTSICFTPTGRYILSASSDKSIHLWDAMRGTLVHSFPGGHSGFIYSISVSPDELMFASSSSDKTVRIWDMNARLPIGGPLQKHTNTVSSVVFSPDGSRIVSGSFDGSLLIWDVATATVFGQPLQAEETDEGERLGHGQTDRTRDADEAHSPSGTSRTSRTSGTSGTDEAGEVHESDGTDRVDGVSQKFLGVRVMSVAWSRDGLRIVSGHSDGTIRLWDAQSGAPLYSPLRGHNGSVTAVAFSPDLHGRRIASGSRDKTVRLWGTASGRELLEAPFRGHASLVHCVAFSPDGKWLASGSADETVRVWNCYADPEDGRVDVLEAGSPVWSVAWSPRDQIAAGCQDCKIRTWTRT